MRAIAKFKALGVPFLSERTGRSASILYRWRKALDDGRGIKDANKRALIAASADTLHPIHWDDFLVDQKSAAA